MNVFVCILGVIYIFMMYFESICQSELLVCMLILMLTSLRQGFIKQPWLTWTSLWSPDELQIVAILLFVFQVLRM